MNNYLFLAISGLMIILGFSIDRFFENKKITFNNKPEIVSVINIATFDGKSIYIITDNQTKKEYIGFTGVGMCERNNKITIEEK